MNNRRRWYVSSVFVFALVAGTRVHAQSGDQGKPPMYTYIAQWSVPRAQWTEMLKLDEHDRTLMDKMVADGTITGYGEFTNMIHQEGEPTHGTWFSATSEGGLLKVLEALYAHPADVMAPVQGASKHWDYILQSRIYNQRSGKSEGGYLSGDQWYVKPGQMPAYNELVKKELVPVYEKLLSDGVITSYGLGTEDYHTGKMGLVTAWYTVADTAAFDKAGKALDEAFENNPAVTSAFRSMVDTEGHRDFLDRLRYVNYK